MGCCRSPSAFTTDPSWGLTEIHPLSLNKMPSCCNLPQEKQQLESVFHPRLCQSTCCSTLLMKSDLYPPPPPHPNFFSLSMIVVRLHHNIPCGNLHHLSPLPLKSSHLLIRTCSVYPSLFWASCGGCWIHHSDKSLGRAAPIHNNWYASRFGFIDPSSSAPVHRPHCSTLLTPTQVLGNPL